MRSAGIRSQSEYDLSAIISDVGCYACLPMRLDDAGCERSILAIVSYVIEDALSQTGWLPMELRERFSWMRFGRDATESRTVIEQWGYVPIWLAAP